MIINKPQTARRPVNLGDQLARCSTTKTYLNSLFLYPLILLKMTDVLDVFFDLIPMYRRMINASICILQISFIFAKESKVNMSIVTLTQTIAIRE